MVGLPAAGKTTRAKELAAAHEALRLTPDAEVDGWRQVFEAPDAAELSGRELPEPPGGWPGWRAWAANRWPSLAADD
jgi:predicted kinase